MKEDSHSPGRAIAAPSTARDREPDSLLRTYVTWGGILVTGFLGCFFFGLIIHQTIWGVLTPTNWVLAMIQNHYAAVIGTPMSAATAFCIVSLLKVTSGPIEFEALGFKFRGASGPIVMWVICFLAVVLAFNLLWMVPAGPSH